MARYAFLALPYPVWSIVYLNTAYQSLSQINEMLHTFLLCTFLLRSRVAKFY